MLRNVFTLLVFVTLFSCNSKSESELVTKVKLEYEEKLQKEKKKNDSLIAVNKELFYSNNDLRVELDNEYVSRTYLDSFIGEEMRFIFNKEETFKYLFNYADLGRISAFRSYNKPIWGGGTTYNRDNYKNRNIRSKEEYLQYIVGIFDRSPENISRFFDERSMKMIYSLFENNHYYESSGLELKVLLLIQVYEDIENKNSDITLNEIYSIYSNHDYDKRQVIIDQFTESQLELLRKYKNYDDEELGYELLPAFSFWGRRNSEGNTNVVYDLLKDFHQNVSKETLVKDSSNNENL